MDLEISIGSPLIKTIGVNSIANPKASFSGKYVKPKYFFHPEMRRCCIFFFELFFLFLLTLKSHSQNVEQTPVSDSLRSNLDFELLIAAGDGDTVKIKSLIEKGSDVNCRSLYEEVTPLMFAAQNGHLAAVQILLHHGANVNALPRNRISALLGACIAGNVYIADTLILNGADLNTRSPDGVTPLMIAAANNDSIMADMLIFYGADLNLSDNKGNTALHYSTYYGSSGIAELLVVKGAAINVMDDHGFTPLMIAAEKGYSYFVDYYILNGADIDTVNKNNWTALSYAVIFDHYESAELLLNRGANPNRQISVKQNQYSLAKEYAGTEMQRLLLAKGAQNIYFHLIHKVIIGLNINGNMKDFMAGGNMTLTNSILGLEVEAGYNARIWVRSVLYETDPYTYYQFWEKRSVLRLGTNKLFNVISKSVQSKCGIFAGIDGAYSWGSFRGSKQKPKDSFHLIPKVGLFYGTRSADLKLNYEYMKLPESGAGPHRINLSIGVNINVSKNKVFLKEKPLW